MFTVWLVCRDSKLRQVCNLDECLSNSDAKTMCLFRKLFYFPLERLLYTDNTMISSTLRIEILFTSTVNCIVF
jgi:hypothetical protein